MVGPNCKENGRLISGEGERESRKNNTKKQTESIQNGQLTSEELGQRNLLLVSQSRVNDYGN